MSNVLLFLSYVGKFFSLLFLTLSHIFFSYSSRKMQYRLPLFLVALIIQTSVAPPVTQQKKDGDRKDKENEVDDIDMVHYFWNASIDLLSSVMWNVFIFTGNRLSDRISEVFEGSGANSGKRWGFPCEIGKG